MQQIEWKGNFGIWTLLAGAIYIVTITKEPQLLHIPRGRWTVTCLALLTVLHVVWLYGVRRSEAADKEKWTHHRYRILKIIGHDDAPEEGVLARRQHYLAVRLFGADEKKTKKKRGWTTGFWHYFAWLAVEGMVTALLCFFLFRSLQR